MWSVQRGSREKMAGGEGEPTQTLSDWREQKLGLSRAWSLQEMWERETARQ